MSTEWLTSLRGIRRACFLLFVLALLVGSARASAQESEEIETGGLEEDPLGVAWVVGPANGELGSIATLEVPEGFVFAGPDDTRKLMEVMQNPTNGSEMGLIAPVDSDWFVVFEFSEIGYVKDDDRSELDAGAILKSLREGQKEDNKAREQRGWETLEILGWMHTPHYDAETNNLEWATRLRTNMGAQNVNYNSRLLGRRGVMSATFVGSEEQVLAGMPSFQQILGGHEFVPGQTYDAFRKGDDIAKYGLTALITGGAAAVLVKTGLFKKLWKFIIVAGAAGLAALRKLFSKRRQSDGADTMTT